MSKRTSLLACLGVYVVALGFAAAVVLGTAAWPTWMRIAAADLVATAVVFAASVVFDNTSFYDPYWSVAPVAIATYLFARAPADPRGVAVLVLFALWGARLTFNWMRRWRGARDEDWRYVDVRTKTGRWYWPASFFGLHLMPTVVVFLGCLGTLAAFESARPLGWLDLVATLLASIAIAVEAVADQQLRRFLDGARAPGEILTTGLWSWSRHPNYFGEVLFWWAVALFGAAAAPDAWWVWIGPAAMTALFAFVSLPLIERRSRTKAGWSDYAARTALFVPRPPRGEAHT